MLYLLETYTYKDYINKVKLLDTRTYTVSYHIKDDIVERLANKESIKGIHIYKSPKSKELERKYSNKIKGLFKSASKQLEELKETAVLAVEFTYQVIYEKATVYSKYYVFDDILILTYKDAEKRVVFEVWWRGNENDEPICRHIISDIIRQYSLETYGAYKLDNKIFIAMTDAIAWYDIDYNSIVVTPSSNQDCMYDICNELWYGDCIYVSDSDNTKELNYRIIESKRTKKQYRIENDTYNLYTEHSKTTLMTSFKFHHNDKYTSSLIQTATLLIPKYNLFQKIQELGIKYFELLLPQLDKTRRLNTALAECCNLLPELTYIISYLVTQDLQTELQELEDRLGIYRIYVSYLSGFEDDYILYNLEAEKEEPTQEKGNEITCRLLMGVIDYTDTKGSMEYSYEQLLSIPFSYNVQSWI